MQEKIEEFRDGLKDEGKLKESQLVVVEGAIDQVLMPTTCLRSLRMMQPFSDHCDSRKGISSETKPLVPRACRCKTAS